MQPARIPPELTARERELLADALLDSLRFKPPLRIRRTRKVSDHVVRTWVSAGCFGEAVQWRLSERYIQKSPYPTVPEPDEFNLEDGGTESLPDAGAPPS